MINSLQSPKFELFNAVRDDFVPTVYPFGQESALYANTTWLQFTKCIYMMSKQIRHASVKCKWNGWCPNKQICILNCTMHTIDVFDASCILKIHKNTKIMSQLVVVANGSPDSCFIPLLNPGNSLLNGAQIPFAESGGQMDSQVHRRHTTLWTSNTWRLYSKNPGLLTL